MTRKERAELVMAGSTLAHMAESMANSDNFQGDAEERAELVASIALQSSAYSLVAIAAALDAIAGDDGIVATMDSQAT